VRRGKAVVQREVLDGWIWSVVPVVEVDTGDDRIGLYRARDTECWWPSHPRSEHRPAHLVTQTPRRSRSIAGGSQLTIARPGDDHTVTVAWDEHWVFWGWYVDIIRPYRATPIGWDFMDLHLDLLVAPDGSTTVKDEEELSRAVEVGQISATESDEAHRRCEQIAEQAATRSGVFGEPWHEWRPDPHWSVPGLTATAARELTASPTRADLHLDWWLA
jgi:uncharacterized protein